MNTLFAQSRSQRYELMGSIMLLALIGLICETFLTAYYSSILVFCGINIILALSLNLINGFAGQFSLGHAGFMSIGAYVAASVSLFGLNGHPVLGLPKPLEDTLWVMLPVLSGGCVAALFGYALAFPSFRLKGDYLAIVTLGFGEIIRTLIYNIDAIGASRGLPGIPKLTTLPLVLGVCALLFGNLNQIRKSGLGRKLLAIRSDELAARTIGINPSQIKSFAFTFGALYAGIAGGLFAHYITFINPRNFDFVRSFEIVTMIVLGGLGSLWGAVVGACLLTILPEALRPLQDLTGLDLRMVLYSILLIAFMLLKPNGILGKRKT